jgi:hypothetical protein
MSWIQRHWDRDYITLAKTKVQQTVSSFALWSEISKLLPKMLEYCEKAGAEGESALTTAVPGVGTGEMPKYMSLAHQYGYDDDDMDFGHGGSNDAEQTVEQEYQAYVTAPLSKDPDILKFWEVSNVSNYVPDFDRLRRSTAILSPPFLRWPWITFPFKRLLSLANESFPRVLKLIQSGGIVSILT